MRYPLADRSPWTRLLALIPLLACVGGRAMAGEVSAALDVGVGGKALLIYGAPPQVRRVHSGATASARVVVDPKSLRETTDALPWPWSSLAGRKTKKVHWNPVPWLPESIILSPGFGDGSALGMSWRVAQMQVDTGDRFKVGFTSGARLTWLSFFGGDVPTTHFLRPGIDLGAWVELPLSERWFLDVGYSSQLYVPQAWGSPPWEIGPQEDWLWHLGEVSLTFHRRRPRTIHW